MRFGRNQRIGHGPQGNSGRQNSSQHTKRSRSNSVEIIETTSRFRSRSRSATRDYGFVDGRRREQSPSQAYNRIRSGNTREQYRSPPRTAQLRFSPPRRHTSPQSLTRSLIFEPPVPLMEKEFERPHVEEGRSDWSRRDLAPSRNTWPEEENRFKSNIDEGMLSRESLRRSRMEVQEQPEWDFNEPSQQKTTGHDEAPWIKHSKDSSGVFMQKSDGHPDIPYFDATNPEYNAHQFLNLIESIGNKEGWSFDNKQAQFGLKLIGAPKEWYMKEDRITQSWSYIRKEFSNAFPSDMDFYDYMERIIRRQKGPNESFATYFTYKTALLKSCNITGRRAVSCLIGGLQHGDLKTEAFGHNFATPELLYNFLCSREDCTNRGSDLREKLTNKIDDIPDLMTQNFGPKNIRVTEKACYKCQETGHLAVNCQMKHKNKLELLGAKRGASPPRCYKCNEQGHLAAQCKRKNKSEPLIKRGRSPSPTREVYSQSRQRSPPHGEPSQSRKHSSPRRERSPYRRERSPQGRSQQRSSPSRDIILDNNRYSGSNQKRTDRFSKTFLNPKYLINVVVNGYSMQGYSDLESQCVTLKEDQTRLARLVYKEERRTIRGFGGNNIKTIGECNVLMRVGNAVVNMPVYIVPDNTQDMPVILGNTLRNHPDISYSEDGGGMYFETKAFLPKNSSFALNERLMQKINDVRNNPLISHFPIPSPVPPVNERNIKPAIAKNVFSLDIDF